MREKFDKYLNRDERPCFKNIAVIYDVIYSISDCRDPNDKMFLELTLSSTAVLFISSDPDLYILNPYRNIAIMQPAVFFTELLIIK